MAIDTKKMRKAYQQQQRGGEFLNFESGETLVYIHPQCRADDKWPPTDGVNFVPIVVHYELGKSKSMIMSLDPELNPIIEHPFIKRILKKKKVVLSGECPAKALLESGDLDDAEMDRARASTRYLWGVTPMAHRADSSEEWRKLSPKPGVLMCGKTLFDGIMEVFFDNGDITDPSAAVLLIVVKTGSKMTTKYKVRVDPESMKKPRKLATEVRQMLAKALAEEGDCDLFKVAANITKSPSEVEALISGVKADDDPDEDIDDEEEDDDPPKKDKGKDKGKKSKKPPPDEDDDDDADDDEDDGESDLDDDDDEPPKKSKEKDKKGKKSRDDDEDEDGDDDDADDDEPPAKVKGKGKKAPPPEDDDEDDDDADDCDDDDDEPPAKAKGKGKKASDDDEDDADEDDSDDDDDEPPAKKDKAKGKSSKKSKGDEDEDLEDDDEPDDDDADDDEPPKSKDKGKKGKSKGSDDDLGLDDIDKELSRIGKGKDKGKKAKE